MTKYYSIPFADSGDKSPIPDAAQPGGQVSYTQGWTVDYQLEQGVNPAAKDVSRVSENQFKFDVTELLKEVQEKGVLTYRPDINYLVDAYVVGSDGDLYKANTPNGPENAETGSILSFSDNGVGGTTVTPTAALPLTIIDGLDITQSGTTNYNATYEIFSVVPGVSYDIAVLFAGDDATGAWDFSGIVDPVGDTSVTWINPISFAGSGVGAFRVFIDNNQDIPTGVATKIQLNQEVFDENAWFDNVTNFRYTPQVAGTYFFHNTVQSSELLGAGSNPWTALIFKNGAEVSQGYTKGTNNERLSSSVSDLIKMNGTTDFIEFYIRHFDGSNKMVSGISEDTYSFGYLLRAS